MPVVPLAESRLLIKQVIKRKTENIAFFYFPPNDDDDNNSNSNNKAVLSEALCSSSVIERSYSYIKA
jgi:hypothetical protein